MKSYAAWHKENCRCIPADTAQDTHNNTDDAHEARPDNNQDTNEK